MDMILLGPEFKGGIWHRYFICAGSSKKDKTLNGIMNEKLRFYNLYYPFLEKKQICGKVYEELGIPHICGDVNRKELYKLYQQQRRKELTFRKKSRKYKNNEHKYGTLLIKNISRKRNNPKSQMSPLVVKNTQEPVITSKKRVDTSKLDTSFDEILFSSTNPRAVTGVEKTLKERMSKQTKNVRFNDGIKVHKISPSKPMRKLKPLGRLFDEPSLVRSLIDQFHTSQEIQEENVESDSEYDADTGVMSDDDDCFEDIPETKEITPEKCTSHQEIIAGTNLQEIISEQTKTRTTYDLPEDELYSTDSDITKEGYDLMLSSKIITVAQGKWLRETERIFENNNEDKLSEKCNVIVESDFRSRRNDPKIIRSEIHAQQNVTVNESFIEKINGLQISRLSEKEGTDSPLSFLQNDGKDGDEKINTKEKITKKSSFSNYNEDKLSEKSNVIVESESISRRKGPKIIRSEIHAEQNVTIDESFIKKINGLQISRLSEQEETDSPHSFLQNDGKDSDEKINTKEKITKKSSFSNEMPLNRKTNNLKILLENNLNQNFVNEEIFVVDGSQLGYTKDLFSNKYKGTEKNLEKGTRNIPDKLLDNDSDLILDWDSSNESTPNKKLQNVDPLHTDTNRNESILTDVTTAKKFDFDKKLHIQNSPEIGLSPKKYEYNVEIIKKANIKNLLDVQKNYLDEKDSFQIKTVTDITKPDPLHIEEPLYQRDGKTLPTSSPIVANIDYKTRFSSMVKESEDITKNEESSMSDNSLETQIQNNDTVNSSFAASTESVVVKKQDLSDLKQIYSHKTKSIIIKSKDFTQEDVYGSSYTKSKKLEDPTKCKLKLYKSRPSKDTASSDSISEPYHDNQPGKKESFFEKDIFKEELSTIIDEGLINDKKDKAINEVQLCNSSVIAMSLTNDLASTSIISHSKDLTPINEGGVFKTFNTDQKIDMDGNQSDRETAELYEGQIIIKRQPGNMSYLSKVQMWSIKSKDYLAKVPLLSEPLSAIVSSNASQSEEKITNTEEEANIDCESTEEEANIDCESLNTQLETSLVNKSYESSTGLNEVDTFTHESSFKKCKSESRDEHYVETESSFCSVVARSRNSDEVSSAYETDPETGKLRINRYLKPIETSTPIVLPSDIKRHPVAEKESNEDFSGSAESLTCNKSPDHHFEKYSNELSIKAETKRDDSAFEPSVEDYLKTASHTYGDETHNGNNTHKSFLPSVNTKVTLKPMTKSSSIININYKQGETNKIVSNYEIKIGGFSGQQCDTDKTSSESIIENSDPDFSEKSRIFKYIENLEATSKQLSPEKQEITEIVNESTFNITDQQRDSSKILSESIIETTNPNTFDEKLALNITGTAHHIRVKKEEYNQIVSHSEDITKSSDSNISYSEFPTEKEDTKNLLFITEPVFQQEITSSEDEAVLSHFKAINNNTTDPRKVSETNYDLDEPNDSESQKCDASLNLQILRNQPSNLSRKSHITFLIRNNDIQESCYSETDAQSVNSLKTNSQPNSGNQLNSQIDCFTSIDKSGTVNNHVFVDHNRSGISTIQQLKNQIILDTVNDEDRVLSSLTEAHTYNNMSPITLKRKLKTITEISDESTNSLSSDDGIIKDNSFVSSTTIQSTPDYHTESSIAGESGSLKISFKKINTHIRKKRAKLIQENPVKKSNTSSSEDDLETRRRSQAVDRLDLGKYQITNLTISSEDETKQNKIQHTSLNCVNTTKVKEEKLQPLNDISVKRSNNNKNNSLSFSSFEESKDSIAISDYKTIITSELKRETGTDIQKSQNGSSLIIKSDMNKKNHTSNNLQKLTSSGSIQNINFSRVELSESLKVEGSPDKNKIPYNKMLTNLSPILGKTISRKLPLSINNDCEGSKHLSTSSMKIKQEKEDNEENYKSQKSFQLYRQGVKNKENTNTILRRSKRSSCEVSLEDSENINAENFNAYTSNNVRDSKRKKNSPGTSEKSDLINLKKEKNVKSSVVRWVNSSEASQIANSPEVNTLLRRTYYMGKN